MAKQFKRGSCAGKSLFQSNPAADLSAMMRSKEPPFSKVNKYKNMNDDVPFHHRSHEMEYTVRAALRGCVYSAPFFPKRSSKSRKGEYTTSSRVTEKETQIIPVTLKK